MIMKSIRVLCILSFLLVVLLPSIHTAQASLPVASATDSQSVPERARYNVRCTGNGIQFVNKTHGKVLIEATFDQIVWPLSVAIAVQQNQPIVIGKTFGLWALMSNELQVHHNANPDQTKMVVKSDICGAINFGAVLPVTSQPIYVVPAMTTTTVQPVAGGTVYIVQPGDTLYRLSRRFGRSVTALAAANGIVNINLIYVGQQLVIP
jgi:LysM repeat protein